EITQSPSPAAGRTAAGIDREILVLGMVIVSGTIMAVLDTTIVNVALDTLGKDLNAQLSTVQWVVTGYLLALGRVIPVTGWAIDRIGGKSVWLMYMLMIVVDYGSMRAQRLIGGL